MKKMKFQIPFLNLLTRRSRGIKLWHFVSIHPSSGVDSALKKKSQIGWHHSLYSPSISISQGNIQQEACPCRFNASDKVLKRGSNGVCASMVGSRA